MLLLDLMADEWIVEFSQKKNVLDFNAVGVAAWGVFVS